MRGGKATEAVATVRLQAKAQERINDARDRLDRALCPTGGSMDFATLEQAVLAIESVLRAAYRKQSMRVDELRSESLLAPSSHERAQAVGKLEGYSEALGALWNPGVALPVQRDEHDAATVALTLGITPEAARALLTSGEVIEAERASDSTKLRRALADYEEYDGNASEGGRLLAERVEGVLDGD